MIFRHQKSFGRYQVVIGSLEGVPGSPGRLYEFNGPKGEHTSPQGAGAPLSLAAGPRGRKGGGLAVVVLSLTVRIGGTYEEARS